MPSSQRDYIKQLEEFKAELDAVSAQTDAACANFERRLRDIAPGLVRDDNGHGGGGATGGGGGGRNAHMSPGSALAACATAQAQEGSLLKAALGASVCEACSFVRLVSHSPLTPSIRGRVRQATTAPPVSRAARRSRCTST